MTHALTSLRPPRRAALLALLSLAAASVPLTAHAAEFQVDRFGGIDINWENQFSTGFQIRTNNASSKLIGKAHLAQNRDLCANDDCLAFNHTNTAPNDRFLAAPGAAASFTDQGDLNYLHAGDITQAVSKWSSDANIAFGPETGFNLSWLYFFDPVNSYFNENRPDIILTQGPQPGVASTTERYHQQVKYIGNALQPRNANFYTSFDYGKGGEHHLDVKVGRQILTWGEAALETQGTLNFVNPFDFNDLVRPGAQFKEIYQPEGMLTLDTNATEDLDLQGFWQPEWRPLILPAKGAFLSFFNAGNEVEPNEGLELPFSKTPDDPLQQERAADPVVRLVSNTSFTARRAPNHNPTGLGEFGFAAHWRPEINGEQSVELGFFAANYHARIPAANVYATNASCTRHEGNPYNNDAANVVDFVNDCGVPGLHTREPLPLDTAQYFLDYPKNIHIFGLSFSTVLADTVVQGEITYRPNQPVQVSLVDTLFAAFQPALPRQTIPITDVGGVVSPILGSAFANAIDSVSNGVVAAYDLPGSREGVPDFLTAYRGGTPGEVAPGQYIPGYQRLGIVQPTITLLKIFGNKHLLGSDEMVLLAEMGAVIIPGLPPLSRIQFEGPGDFTSYGPSPQTDGDALHLNPYTTHRGWVTQFSAGSRFGLLADYHDVVLSGLSLRPEIFLTWDLFGVSPGLGEDYLQGRKIAVLDVQAAHRNGFSVDLVQSFVFGGGPHDTLGDRQFAGMTVTYKF